MSLYPSLEALQIDKEVKAQNALAETLMSTPAAISASGSGVNYASLASEFLGLDLSLISYDEYGNPCYGGTPSAGAIAPSAGAALAPTASLAIERKDPITVSQGVREISVRKNPKGYVGLQLRNQDKGVFVTYVECDSPASKAGLRFGDQVLKINEKCVAGMSGKDTMNFISKKCGTVINFVIRDRPLERVVTLAKDSYGNIGLLIKNGAVDSIVKDSSAARNGVLINSQIVEVNGVNVLGMSDKKIGDLLKCCGNSVKLTLLPSFYFEHLSRKLGRGLLKHMDRSEPMA